ncbi:hypothetical protein TYRP_015055 [Tyrophagus putrescentiae]|nr:hypothetical protein TYRP_015055 [Tyrophagus putrescentiae]
MPNMLQIIWAKGTNLFTLSSEITNAQFAPNYSAGLILSRHTNWFTLAFELTSAQHAPNRLG